MKFLIHINTDSELISYEAIALALTLATFDHDVQIELGEKVLVLLNNPKSRIYGMIQSLALYDLPKAYHNFQAVDALDKIIQLSLQSGSLALDDYDSKLYFQ
ncbi:hypothetical protein D6D69_00465 [Moraxella catarrhalis]|uniref:hypothetical protein n=1 Tax=Moraxella catarrhalis TaxID=480 RepID=UPI0007E2F393|nr:hypothetical protein [Moraxella catarrhalis]OAV12084.1 hypothetical protein AO378_0119 [Moraxella catarrhalis]RKM23925.1 hypothetical protein D6D69_00465 [Moraxella catarrhalis]